MRLIGQFDSPFVRRVAVSLDHLGISFAHEPWSVGAQQQEIRRFNPLGRVPVLVLDDGNALVESSSILDYLDDRVGPERALLPAHGEDRWRAQKLVALAIGAVEKALQIAGERVYRPAEKRHAPYLERCTEQLRGALDALEGECATRGNIEWLDGHRMLLPDITLACVTRYIAEAAAIDLATWPALKTRVDRYEALPLFRRYYAHFEAPVA